MLRANSAIDACLAGKQFPSYFPKLANDLQTPALPWPKGEESFLEQRPPKFPPASSPVAAAALRPTPIANTITILERMSTRFHQLTQQQKEAKWLAENRARYAGLWIALEGDELLASGPSAKEIFAQVAHRSSPALVMQIESAPLPFSGW